MSAGTLKRRPKYLNLRAILFEIRLPLTAWVSILHRISGALLFAIGAWLLYLLQLGLSSEEGFAQAKANLAGPLPKAVIALVLWAYCHHFFAGLRFLLLDVGVGVEKKSARASSALVLIASLVATALLTWKLW